MEKQNNAAISNNVVRLATTTSMEDTGLLDVIKPAFGAASGYDLQWTAVGSGAALDLGRHGLADITLTHARLEEEAFVRAGYGLDRVHIMYNWFILVGPRNGRLMPGAGLADAFTLIVENSLPFASRGDNSGTNIREMQIWDYIGEPNPERNPNYIPIQAGMLKTLQAAAACNMNCLTDDGTWIRLTANGSNNITGRLTVISSDDPLGFNQYAVIPVNPEARFQGTEAVRINAAGTSAFTDWLRSDAARQLINDYRIWGSNKQVFVYNAGQAEPPFPFTAI